MTELVPFLAAVVAMVGAGIAAGILIARRIDAWEVARDSTGDRNDGSDEEPDA